MVGLEFRVEGLEEVERALKRLSDQAGKAMLRSATRAAARVVQKEAINLAPVREEGPTHPKYGHLRDNIKIVMQRGRQAGVQEAAVGTTRAFWARFVEFGTARMAAQPFMTPAFEAAQQDALKAFVKSYVRAFEREAQREAGVRGRARR